MLSRIEVFFRRLRRMISRSEWSIRLLGLSQLKTPTAEPGLVMVQIDGLSMAQFNRALSKGHLPFLKTLMTDERYMLRSFYSGLPSNTPAVQAELFYGVKGAVPAFYFYERQTGRRAKMLDTSFVSEFEKRLKGIEPGFVAGGSAYSDIYSGGAKETHCCFSNMGWEGLLSAANPLVLPFLILLYLDIFVRTLFLMVIEFILAIVECMRGTLKGRVFFRELELVYLRSLVCVFLREFVTAGVCIDIMRGLPVIHVNYLGYDEQAHGRGPSSDFAHWSLQGIDAALKRIYRVLRQSPCRHYDLWVYSDHGQAKTIPYFVKYGRTIEEAVQELFGGHAGPYSLKTRQETIKSRVSILKGCKHNQQSKHQEDLSETFILTAMGPLGHIYVNKPLSYDQMHFYAKNLVSEAHIPLVLTKEAAKLLAWTPQGCFIFPDEAQKVAGDHPFLEEIKEDLMRLCFHPDAGEFVIAGWSVGQEAISFPLEYGAHAGMEPEETHGFTLLPVDAPVLLKAPKEYLRPLDLKNAVEHFLNRQAWASWSNPQGPSKILTLMSYNVHSCVGMDGRISTERIARVIARHNPDVIALQELDVGRIRSGRIDQAEIIARKLEMRFHFNPAFRSKDEQFGNAILSRYPMALIKSGALPHLEERGRQNETRGALWVRVECEGQKVNVFNTHLSLSPRERVAQTDALLGPEWIGHPDARDPVILCGDFNALPESVIHRKLCVRLNDSQLSLSGHRPKSTWFGHYPIGRIDYVFVDKHFQVYSISVPRTDLERGASDHLPLVAQVNLLVV